MFGVGVEFVRPRCPVEAVAVDAATAEVEEFGVAFGVAVVGFEAYVPMFANRLFAFEEEVGGAAVPVGPVGAVAFAAFPVGEGAVGVGDGQSAPHGAVFVVALVADAEAQAGVGGDVGIEYAVEGGAFVFFAVDEGFATLVVGDEAATQVAGGGERLAVVGA